MADLSAEKYERKTLRGELAGLKRARDLINENIETTRKRLQELNESISAEAPPDKTAPEEASAAE